MSNARDLSNNRLLTLATAQATTSGTFKDFTDIPSWVKRITISFSSLSTSGVGGAALLVQIGSGSVDTSGYLSSSGIISGSNSTGSVSSTAGFVSTTGLSGTTVVHGSVILTHLGSNVWVASGSVGATQAFSYTSGGTKTLSGVLDRVRFTTTNGTDAFDAGTLNILYE